MAVFGSLFVKTWQIHFIFNTSQLHVRRVSRAALLSVLGCLLLLEAITTILWTQIDMPQAIQTVRFACPLLVVH